MKIILTIAENADDHKIADHLVAIVHQDEFLVFQTQEGDDLQLNVNDVELQE